jgi:hypothetical protein
MYPERKGEHNIHVRLFIGPDSEHLALSGTLVFRVGEWQFFGAALILGAHQAHENLSVEIMKEKGHLANG